MEYSAEVAVFQSACALADTSYPDGLKNFHRCGHNAEFVRQIVRYCVAEITNGLGVVLPSSPADHWKLMLTVMSTWRTISCVPKLSDILPADDLVTDFIQLLPEWNFAFFYDLIKHNNLIQQFLQVVDATQKSAGLLLVQLILDELNGNTLDAGDIQIIIGILEYFTIIENKYMSCLALENDSGLELGDGVQSVAAAVPPHKKMPSSNAAARMSSTTHDVSVTVKNGQRNLRILMCDENFVSGSRDTSTKAGGKVTHTQDVESETSVEEGNVEDDAIIEVLQKYFKKSLSIDLSTLTCVADSSRLLVAVLNLANFVVGGSVVVFKNHCLFESDSLCPRYAGPNLGKAAPRSLTDDEFDRLIALSVVECPLLHIESPGFSDSSFDECLDGVQEIVIAFSECLLPVRNYLCQTAGVIDVTGVLVIHPVLRLDCYRRILLNAYDHLVVCAAEFEVEGLQYSIQFLSDLCVSSVSQCVQSLDARKDDPLLDFERALVVVEKNFVGGKEQFDWLIETDCVDIMKDPRWLKCLENHWDRFPISKSNAVQNLLRALKTSKLHLSEEYLNRLQQLILKVYSHLSLDEQSEVLMLLYGGSEPSPFDVNSRDFARRLLNAQSKLMTSDLQQIRDADVLNDFSFLVFQRPLETLERLVLVAVKNKQHIDVVAKMILQLPILTVLENENGDLVVLEIISNWLWMAETFKDEEHNATALCRHLLKSSSNDRHLHLSQRFLQCCILSHGSHLVTTLDSASNLLSAHLTLELITVYCESLALRRHDWPSEDGAAPRLDSHCIAPLAVWLCQVIDNCRNLWLAWNQYCLKKTVLKERAVSALNCLLEMLVSCVDEVETEKKEQHEETPCVSMCVQIQWLLQQLSRLHWTISHYVRPLFNNRSGQFPLCYPEPLAKVLQRHDVKSTVLELPELVALFEFCRISDDTLEVALNGLTLPDVSKGCRNFYSKVTISLARVLLNSILPEWFRIGRIVKRLLCDYFILQKTHKISGESLLSLASTEMAVCKVFVDAILLIKTGAPEYSNEQFLSIWLHLANAFSAYFKTASLTMDNVQFAKVGIGLILQFVCIAPKAATQPLDILLADIISVLKADSGAISEIRAAFAEIDSLVDMATSKAILDQIVM